MELKVGPKFIGLPGLVNITNQTSSSSLPEAEFILPTTLRLDPLYIKYYLIYTNMITHTIIPFLTLTTLNTAIYRKVCL